MRFNKVSKRVIFEKNLHVGYPFGRTYLVENVKQHMNENPEFQLHNIKYEYKGLKSQETYQFKPHFVHLVDYLLEHNCKIAFFCKAFEARN